MVLGKMDVAQVKSIPFSQGDSAVCKPGLHPTDQGSGGHQLPRGDSRSAPYPVDGVHQSRIAEYVGGWRMDLGEDRNRGRTCRCRLGALYQAGTLMKLNIAG